MNNVLCAWLGKADINASKENNFIDKIKKIGPIAETLDYTDFKFNTLLLLNDWKGEGKDYINKLKERLEKKKKKCDIIDKEVNRTKSPTNISYIYEIAKNVLDEYSKDNNSAIFTFLLSPGTAMMQAVWIFLSSHYDAKLLESSIEKGVLPVNLPFDLQLKFREEKSYASPEKLKEFKNLILPNDIKKKIKIFADNNHPVLLLGESGTGKEVIARCIHDLSKLNNKPYRPINCGAFTHNLLASELFGYVKGAFTGAEQNTPGIFEKAVGGTVFLDEIGDIPKDQQVYFLRLLEEKKVRRIGDDKEIPVNCRIIAATNKNLYEEIKTGNFREDLFYRLVVLVITIPPLRERKTEEIQKLAIEIFNSENKKLSKPLKMDNSFIDEILKYHWPGNVRELMNTIIRAMIMTKNGVVTKDNISFLTHSSKLSSSHDQDIIINQDINAEDFKLDNIIREVKYHYLREALKKSHGEKTGAAKLLYKNNKRNLIDTIINDLQSNGYDLSDYIKTKKNKKIDS
ncbi:MAG: sigma 54-interacting transcriptional regulator [Desulfobacterales bacterium]|nr:sigma 54-interacting transcriptional regulator [Desulfobacterales bacterium]